MTGAHAERSSSEPTALESVEYDLSLVIACYNEEGHLEESVRAIVETLSATRYSFELIFIDDCSSDRTRELVVQLATGRPNMRYVLHERNVGRGGTVGEGFGLARGRIVGFIDIDLEVHCRYIPTMIQAIDDGADCATAFRIYKTRLHAGALLRHVLSRGYRTLTKGLLGAPLQDTETGYKFFRRSAVLPVLEQVRSDGWFWDTEIMMLSWGRGLEIREIPCLFIQRTEKASTVRVWRDTRDYLVSLFAFRRRFRQLRLQRGEHGENRRAA